MFGFTSAFDVTIRLTFVYAFEKKIAFCNANLYGEPECRLIKPAAIYGVAAVAL